MKKNTLINKINKFIFKLCSFIAQVEDDGNLNTHIKLYDGDPNICTNLSEDKDLNKRELAIDENDPKWNTWWPTFFCYHCGFFFEKYNFTNIWDVTSHASYRSSYSGYPKVLFTYKKVKFETMDSCPDCGLDTIYNIKKTDTGHTFYINFYQGATTKYKNLWISRYLDKEKKSYFYARYSNQLFLENTFEELNQTIEDYIKSKELEKRLLIAPGIINLKKY